MSFKITSVAKYAKMGRKIYSVGQQRIPTVNISSSLLRLSVVSDNITAKIWGKKINNLKDGEVIQYLVSKKAQMKKIDSICKTMVLFGNDAVINMCGLHDVEIDLGYISHIIEEEKAVSLFENDIDAALIKQLKEIMEKAKALGKNTTDMEKLAAEGIPREYTQKVKRIFKETKDLLTMLTRDVKEGAILLEKLIREFWAEEVAVDAITAKEIWAKIYAGQPETTPPAEEKKTGPVATPAADKKVSAPAPLPVSVYAPTLLGKEAVGKGIVLLSRESTLISYLRKNGNCFGLAFRNEKSFSAFVRLENSACREYGEEIATLQTLVDPLEARQRTNSLFNGEVQALRNHMEKLRKLQEARKEMHALEEKVFQTPQIIIFDLDLHKVAEFAEVCKDMYRDTTIIVLVPPITATNKKEIGEKLAKVKQLGITNIYHRNSYEACFSKFL